MRFLTKKGFLIVVLSLFFLGFTHHLGYGIWGLADTVASVVVYPVYRFVGLIQKPLRGMHGWFTTVSYLKQKVEFLQNHIEKLQAEQAVLIATSVYHENTKELIAFKNRFDVSNGLICSVISWHISFDQQYCLIDAGSLKGISSDMVAVYKNVLVGKVAEVYPLYAKIILITDRHCAVPAYCFASGTQGVHEGNGLAVPRLNFVGHFENVSVGEAVLTNGQGLIFPQGFLIGTVKKVMKDHLGLNLVIDVEPAFKPAQCSSVCLIKKGDPNC